MGWQDLLAPPKGEETLVYPWTGGREVRASKRTFTLEGKWPKAHGWHSFRVTAPRKVAWVGEATLPDWIGPILRGYIAGGRFIPDTVSANIEPSRISEHTDVVWLYEPGLERFSRIAVRRWEDGRLLYIGQEFPLGPEGSVTEAYQDRKESVTGVANVTPALDLAFRFESWNRAEAARIREEAERMEREAALQKDAEARRAALAKQLGTGEGRREMARVDFGEAARAALRVGGAELLDWRDSHTAGEAVVQFRYPAGDKGQRFECVAHKATLRIIDAGICLTDHQSGQRGDTYFTLESLPGVIAQAIRERRLVVFRHVDQRGGYVGNDGDFRDEDVRDDDSW